jgi:RHS repeat-associated protein
VDARNITTNFSYNDPLSRPTLIQYDNGSDEDVTTIYDRDTIKTVKSTMGGGYTYVYDSLNRVIEQDWFFANQTYKTTYHYNSSGCLDQMHYPTGATVLMTCDSKDRTLSINLGTQSAPDFLVSNVIYHPNGLPTSIEYGNAKSQNTVIENGRIKSINSAGVIDLTYSYDGANNVKGITDAITSTNTVGSCLSGTDVSCISYDELDRLSAVPTGLGEFSFQYDELGNRKEVDLNGSVLTKYGYDYSTNRLDSSTGSGVPLPVKNAFSGASIGQELVSLSWNKAGYLASSSDGTTYAYDGYGRRVAKQRSPARRLPRGADIVYHYDRGGRLLAESSLNGTRWREYFYVGNRLVAVTGCLTGPTLLQPFCTTGRYWYHTDLTGSVVALTDAHGAPTHLSYKPWGEANQMPQQAGTRLLGARTFDGETSFYDYGARMYSPELARFISPDPAWALRGVPQAANLYSYVLNNPYKYTDPTGRGPKLEWWADRLKSMSRKTKEVNEAIEQTQNEVESATEILKNTGNSAAAEKLEAITRRLGVVKEDVKAVAELATNASKVTEFAAAVDDLRSVDIKKEPDRAAKAFDRLAGAAGELASFLPEGPWKPELTELLKAISEHKFFEKTSAQLKPHQYQNYSADHVNAEGELIPLDQPQ